MSRTKLFIKKIKLQNIIKIILLLEALTTQQVIKVHHNSILNEVGT